MGNKDTSALNGTLNSPPGFTGRSAPIVGDTGAQLGVVRAINAGTQGNAAPAGKAATDALHTAVGLLAFALIALWALGGIVFKNANV